MSQLNAGPTRGYNGVVRITLFGIFLFVLAFLVALFASASSTGAARQGASQQFRPEDPDDMCWQVVPGPGAGAGELRAVEAVSANDVWVVGGSLAYWNGTAWTLVPSGGHLKAVDALSADDVWAVGEHGSPLQTLVEHWNGTAWEVVPSPNQGTGSNTLHGVAAVSTDDVWAVGYSTAADGVRHTLVEHWNGAAWEVVPSPSSEVGDSALDAVAAVSAGDVWAVGEGVIEYQHGTAIQTLVEHWNGAAWEVVPSPNRNYNSDILYNNHLNGVAVVTADDVWAVGYYDDVFVTDTPKTLVEHWDGSTWGIVSSPNVGYHHNYLYAVAAVSADDIWAVGNYYENVTFTRPTLVEHWDGSAWSVVPSPSPGIFDNFLYGVVAVSADNVWAVGNANSDETPALVERYATCPIASTPTPEPCTEPYFSDAPPGSTFYTYVSCLVSRSIISGYPDCTFRPNNPVTRGQLAKIVSNAAGFIDVQSFQKFQDVPVGSTFFQYIGRLAERTYMSGYACGGANEPCVPPNNLPYFRPTNKASRGQLAKLVSNAAGFQDDIPTTVQTFTDVPPNSTFWLYVQRLLLNRPGVMGGYPCGGANEPCDPQQRPYFRPGNNVTRGQVSKIVANTFFPNCQRP